VGDVYAPRSGANETEPLAKRSHNDGVLGGLRRASLAAAAKVVHQLRGAEYSATETPRRREFFKVSLCFRVSVANSSVPLRPPKFHHGLVVED